MIEIYITNKSFKLQVIEQVDEGYRLPPPHVSHTHKTTSTSRIVIINMNNTREIDKYRDAQQ